MGEQFPSFDCGFEFLNDIVNTNRWLSSSEVVSVQVESKVRSSLSALPRRDWTEANSAVQIVWYENRPLGVNTLGTMMKEIGEKAVLSTVYTSQCVRATAITLWSEASLADRHICHIRATETRTVSNITIPGHRQLSSESAEMFCHLL